MPSFVLIVHTKFSHIQSISLSLPFVITLKCSLGSCILLSFILLLFFFCFVHSSFNARRNIHIQAVSKHISLFAVQYKFCIVPLKQSEWCCWFWDRFRFGLKCYSLYIIAVLKLFFSLAVIVFVVGVVLFHSGKIQFVYLERRIISIAILTQ